MHYLTTVRCLLVHPKEKVEPEEQGELDKHKKDVENAPKERYTRSEKQQKQSTTNTSAPTGVRRKLLRKGTVVFRRWAFINVTENKKR